MEVFKRLPARFMSRRRAGRGGGGNDTVPGHRPGRRANQIWDSIGFRVVAIDLGRPVRFGAAALDTFDSRFDSRPGPPVLRFGAGSLAAAARDRRLRGPAPLAVTFKIDDFTHNRHGLRSSGPERIVCPTVRLSLA